MSKYAFMKDDIPELKDIDKVMVVIVETKEGSTSGIVLDAAVFKKSSEELKSYVTKWLA